MAMAFFFGLMVVNSKVNTSTTVSMVMVSSSGLTVAGTKASGVTVNNTAKALIEQAQALRNLVSGEMDGERDGLAKKSKIITTIKIDINFTITSMN